MVAGGLETTGSGHQNSSHPKGVPDYFEWFLAPLQGADAGSTVTGGLLPI